MGVDGGTDRRIAQIASAQYGRIARWQMLEAGITPDSIKARIHRGALTRVARGVYAPGHTARGLYEDELAALLAVPRGAMLSHLTAARLWKIHEPTTDGLVHVLVRRNSSRDRDRVCVHRTQRYERIRPAYLYGLPVTTVPTTLIQIAPMLVGGELERALDEALARGLTSLAAVRRITAACPRRPGTPLLRQLVSQRIDGAGISREGAEEVLLDLIRRAGFPEPHRNVQLGEFSADFFWPHLRMAVEFDSYQWHMVKRNFERDRRKDIAFKAQGIDLTRLTWDAITRRDLETVAMLAMTMAAREQEIGVTTGVLWPTAWHPRAQLKGIFTTPL